MNIVQKSRTTFGMENTATATDRVAANIRAEIARQRLSQSTVAGAVAMSPAALSQRLTGKTPIDVNELERLAVALNVPAESLLGKSA